MAAKKARKRFRDLIGRILSGKATMEEADFAEAYYRHFDREQGWAQQLPQQEKEALAEKIFIKIEQGIDTPNGVVLRMAAYKRMAFKIAVAASVLLVIMLMVFKPHITTKKSDPMSKLPSISSLEDMAPGVNKAILTLSDGTTVLIDSARNGLLAKQGQVQVIKPAGGELSYNAMAAKNVQAAINTIQTPRGGEFLVVLADGTRVWLNAASYLRFPTVFTGSERIVELEGEAYFEVAQQANAPFKVKVKDQVVEVLGTHFNLMAYADEPVVQTTLLQGKVKVVSGNASKILLPGQQAVLAKDGRAQLSVKKVNTAHFVAWKNGKFSFDNTDAYTMMRQISRWYNVDIHYTDSLDLRFNGSLNKHVNAATLFSMLELTGEIQCTVANGILTIGKR